MSDIWHLLIYNIFAMYMCLSISIYYTVNIQIVYHKLSKEYANNIINCSINKAAFSTLEKMDIPI